MPPSAATALVIVLVLLLVLESVFPSITSTRRNERLALLRAKVAYIFPSAREKRRPVTATSAATVRQKCFVRQQ
jgi:hypothetical protein